MQPNGQERGPVFREGGAFVFPRCGGWLLFPLLFLFLLGMVTPLQGQVDPWNGARVLDLIREARTVRQDQVQDSTLQSYSSNARGFVYFYLDREDTGERILVKTDQIALEVFWKAPDQFKQRIVGLRDEESLPTNINYHLDHLVVVQDEFGDRIRIGDGDEVEAVMRSRRTLRPRQENTFAVESADAVLDFMATITRILFAVLPGLVSVSLVVGGIVIMNIMLMSVAERTREIGIRKSLGARRKDILRQFLVEATTLAILGAAIGIGAGLGLAAIVDATTPLPATVAPWSIVVAVVLGAGVGVTAGIYPASRAARLDPVDAMRHE